MAVIDTVQTLGVTTPCREWLGPFKTQGYGFRTINGRQSMVHRWVMTQVYGREALAGKVVMHRCDNPKCYRFDHLQVGTQGENVADCRAKGRGNDALGERHGGARWTEADVLDMRARSAAGESLKTIAARYGTWPQSVGQIVRRKLWKHLP